MTSTATPTALYRCFDRTDVLLYVDITSNPNVRFPAHTNDKAWWGDVARIALAWHDSRAEAGAAEVEAIRTEGPKWNLALPTEDGRFRIGVGRRKWTSPNSEVAAEIEAVVADFARVREDETKAKARLAKLADPTGPAVPIAHLAERLGVERKTVYRHLGRSMT